MDNVLDGQQQQQSDTMRINLSTTLQHLCQTPFTPNSINGSGSISPPQKKRKFTYNTPQIQKDEDFNQKIHCLQYHKDTVLCVATCRLLDNTKQKLIKYIFSGSQDSSISVWNTDTFQLETILCGHSRSILGLYVIDDSIMNPLLLSTSRDNCICIWDIKTLSLLFRLTHLPSLCYDFEVLSFPKHGGNFVWFVCQDTNIFTLCLSILPYLMQIKYAKLKDKKDEFAQLLILNNPSILSPAGFKQEWVKNEDKMAQKFNECQPDNSDASVQFLSNSPSELCEIYDNECLDKNDFYILHRVFNGCHHGFIYAIKQFSDDYTLITASSDGTLKIWNVDFAEKQILNCLSVLIGHNHSVINFDFMRNDYLVSISRDCTLRIWNIANIHKPHTRHTLHQSSELTAIKVIAKNNLIVSAARDGSVVFWNGTNYKIVKKYKLKRTKRMKSIYFDNAMPSILHKHWTQSQSNEEEEKSPICVMSFDFVEPSWLLLSDTGFQIQIWDILDILHLNAMDAKNECFEKKSKAMIPSQHIKLSDIESVLNGLGLNEYLANFKSQKVDFDTLFYLSNNDLIHLDIPLGPRKKLLNYINKESMSTLNVHADKSNIDGSQAMIADLAKFIAFKSISCKKECKTDCWDCSYFIQAKCEEFGAETRLVQGQSGKNPVVLAKFCSNEAIDCKSTYKIVMYGHYDVVDINNVNGWLTPPFVLTAVNGYLYGRGTTDNKGPIIVFLYAIREILNEDKIDQNIEIILILEGQEEHEWNDGGLKEVVERNLDWLAKPELIICSNSYWLNDEVPCLVYGMRGHAQIQVKVSGSSQDCHSGVHGGAFSEPMMDLVLLLSKLKDYNNRVMIPGFYDGILALNKDESQKYDEIVSTFDSNEYLEAIGFEKGCDKKLNAKDLLMQKWRNPSLSVHRIMQSSNECTVISRYASAVLSIRTVPNQKNGQVIELCKKYLEQKFAEMTTFNKLKISAKNIGDHWLMDHKNYIFKCAENAIIKHWEVKPYYIREGGTIPCTNYLKNKLNAPILQFPLGQSSDRAHLENERIRLQNLTKGKDVIKSFLMNLLKHKSAANY